jgi:hypothetical protein
MTVPRSEDHAEYGVTIGLREIYDQVRDAVSGIANLSRQIDDMKGDQTTTTTAATDLEKRVRALEQKPVVTPASMWSAIGVLCAVVGAVATLITLMMR